MNQKTVKQYLEQVEKRLKLQREIDNLKVVENELKTQIVAHVEEKGDEKKQVQLGQKYLLSMKKHAGTVKWKNEFVRVAGPDQATELQSKAEPTFRLSVTQL